jgi:hypothetical protein
MPLGILGEYAKSLFASSPCTHRFFPCIIQIRLNTLRVFVDDFVYRNNPVCYILHIRLNTDLLFSEYAERMENTQKEIFTFKNAWGL